MSRPYFIHARKTAAMNASRLAVLIAKATQEEPRNVADDDTINIANDQYSK